MQVIETTAEWRAKEGRKLCQQITSDLMNRGDWETQRLEARALYYGQVARPDIHWEGGTDIHLPVVYENIERLVPKLNNAIWNVWPHVIVDRVPSEYDPEESRIQEHFINWAVDYDIPSFYMTTHQWFRNALLDGVSSTKTQWVTRWRKTCEVHRLKLYKRSEMQQDPNGQPQMESKSPMEFLDELFGRGQWFPLDEFDGEQIRLNIVEDRRPVEGVRVVFRDTSQFVDEVEVLVYRPILVCDNPEVSVVEPENLIVPPRTRCIQSAKRVTHQHWMTLEDLEHVSHEARFDPWTISEEDWDLLRNVAKSNEPKDDGEQANNMRIQEHKDAVVGVDPGVKAGGDENEIRMYEVYKKADIDGDGIQEELVLQVSPDLNKVLHVTYLDTLHPHGRRPFPTIHFAASTDSYYTPGLATFLAPLNMQANITINQVNDRQTLINNPIFFYRPTALQQDPDALKDLRPGEGIETMDPGGVVFPSWGTAPLADLQIMDLNLAFADRVGTSPIMGGNTMPNAPRTARGTLTIMSEGNIKVDVLISLAQKEGFQELFQQVFGLYQVNMPDEKHFWATGRDRKRRPEMISRRLMRGRYEFRFRGNTVNTNPEVQRTLAQIRYQVASTNPLYAQDPVKFRELLRDFLEAHSDGTSVERILPDLPGGGAYAHPPMAQADEITAMRLHRMVEVLESDNHIQHIADIDRFRSSPAFEALDEVAVSLLAQHYMQHQQAMARQQQMQRLQSMNAGGNDGGSAGGAASGIGLSELGL